MKQFVITDENHPERAKECIIACNAQQALCIHNDKHWFPIFQVDTDRYTAKQL